MSKYPIREPKLDELINRAVRAAKKGSKEICGLIVDNKCCLDLIECKNKSRRPAHSEFYYQEVRRIVNVAKTLNYEVVGTFHSHPFGLAQPGKTDINYAVNDSLMLIIDCTNRKAKLWHIKNGKAKRVQFKIIP
ncbi:MAG TPA: Mov34/MPN/PAD-1 family protein [Candidatus Binataceae bacterium]|nr:Mov34/MPN/PAD-1 family protein [Candidatus Binataceae bacterium]